MNIDKQTRARIQQFARQHHHTGFFPVNDTFVVEYFGSPVFTIGDGFVILEPTRRNWTTLTRLNELLDIFNIGAAIVVHYRDWMVEHKGVCEPLGTRYVIVTKQKPTQLKARAIE